MKVIYDVIYHGFSTSPRQLLQTFLHCILFVIFIMSHSRFVIIDSMDALYILILKLNPVNTALNEQVIRFV